MADGRRATCRHWDNIGHDDGESWGTCWLAASDAGGEPVEGISLAVAQVGGQGGPAPATLVTAPVFGCVQWAAHPERDGTTAA